MTTNQVIPPDSVLHFAEQAIHPRRSLWRRLVALIVGSFAALVVLSILSLVAQPALQRFLPGDLASLAAAGLSLFVAGTVLALITCALLRLSPGQLVSVTGRFRWKLFGLYALACVPVMAVFLIGSVHGIQRSDWLLATLVVFAVIPFQVAGEELAFRGAIQQSVSALLARWRFRLVAAALVSAAMFSAAHQPGNIQGLVAFLTFGLVFAAAGYLTGGLEAPLAIHLINNLYSLGTPTIQVDNTNLLTQNATQITWGNAAFSVAINVAALVVIVLISRRLQARTTAHPS
ncbi:CPBP family intramembrane glutamic endopeptidase [Kocuria sp.]|uniref:CPBP family intramembrane glutamic endopeptidase n=1 Tax=Kocuria sp. TaxID=1871328 RepID=UPI0026E00FE5|nr:type II CAAX endopeptidase family protein [Kocuria sp.]MDO5619216.1 type II CAAX endopeptidase family protein [Kocuria sp.]